MADEVAEQSMDLSGDLPKPLQDDDDVISSGADLDIVKTLPPPPAPSGKPLNRPNLENLFSPLRDMAPATPLNAVTPVKVLPLDIFATVTRENETPLHAGTPWHALENGLDALERRLLADVGTRKAEKDHVVGGGVGRSRTVISVNKR